MINLFHIQNINPSASNLIETWPLSRALRSPMPSRMHWSLVETPTSAWWASVLHDSEYKGSCVSVVCSSG